MPATRHADRAPSFRPMRPADRPVGVRPAMRPGTTDKASAVAHYEAMAQQVALERSAADAPSATAAPVAVGAQRRG